MKYRFPVVLMAALSGPAVAAPVPSLETTAATICAANSKEPDREWEPTQAQIRALEESLGSYFAGLPEARASLPAPNVRYARQYSGVVLDGRKLIHGRFYPSTVPAPFFAKAGKCWVIYDGGNRYWDVYFDPETGKVVEHQVNGVA